MFNPFDLYADFIGDRLTRYHWLCFSLVFNEFAKITLKQSLRTDRLSTANQLSPKSKIKCCNLWGITHFFPQNKL
ncbi:MAG TPA: hypothetical protein PKI60_00870 [Oscillospiraceae bacterium]|nr:hypothetical protein [Oscillospiraceae bacterium]